MPMRDRDIYGAQDAAGSGYTIKCSARRRSCTGSESGDAGVTAETRSDVLFDDGFQVASVGHYWRLIASRRTAVDLKFPCASNGSMTMGLIVSIIFDASIRYILGIKGNLRDGAPLTELPQPPGHGFCVVGTRICHEMWVTDSAWYVRRNGA